MPNASALTDYFATHIPVMQFMEVNVDHYDGESLTLSAPLSININDKQTAFGGSLSNIAVMVCWGMIYLKLQEQNIDCDMVIAKANVEFKAPVKGELKAVCQAPATEEFDAFISRFKERGKAKISLKSCIEYEGREAVAFEGTYAIMAKQ